MTQLDSLLAFLDSTDILYKLMRYHDGKKELVIQHSGQDTDFRCETIWSFDTNGDLLSNFARQD